MSKNQEELAKVRNSPSAAGEIVRQLIPKQQLSSVLEAVAQSVQVANEASPAKWGLRLNPENIMIKVGMVETLQVLAWGFRLLVLSDLVPKKLRSDERLLFAPVPYKNAPGIESCNMEFSVVAEVYSTLLPAHGAAIRVAARSGRHSTTTKDHSPGLVEFISQELGPTLPQPAYFEVTTKTVHTDLDVSGTDWTPGEIDVAVKSYFDMLSLEAGGIDYIKAEHIRQAAKSLKGRSKGSIEFKYGNVSSVLIELGLPYIPGYQPYPNIQNALVDGVVRFLVKNPEIGEQVIEGFSDVPKLISTPPTVGNVFVDPPTFVPSKKTASVKKRAHGVNNIDYAARDARNSALGKAGEEFVVEIEKMVLVDAKRPDLAANVEHVSVTLGDGLGFDVQSFFKDGRKKLIEVKTTNGGSATPFYISASELQMFEDCAEGFRLYRVYDFKDSPHIFEADLSAKGKYRVEPVQYRVRLGNFPLAEKD